MPFSKALLLIALAIPSLSFAEEDACKARKDWHFDNFYSLDGYSYTPAKLTEVINTCYLMGTAHQLSFTEMFFSKLFHSMPTNKSTSTESISDHGNYLLSAFEHSAPPNEHIKSIDVSIRHPLIKGNTVPLGSGIDISIQIDQTRHYLFTDDNTSTALFLYDGLRETCVGGIDEFGACREKSTCMEGLVFHTGSLLSRKTPLRGIDGPTQFTIDTQELADCMKRELHLN